MKFTGAALASLAVAGSVANIACKHQPESQGPSRLSDKIKNVVILIQENRSFDTVMGGLT
jgi:phospholipase C